MPLDEELSLPTLARHEQALNDCVDGPLLVAQVLSSSPGADFMASILPVTCDNRFFLARHETPPGSYYEAAFPATARLLGPSFSFFMTLVCHERPPGNNPENNDISCDLFTIKTILLLNLDDLPSSINLAWNDALLVGTTHTAAHPPPSRSSSRVTSHLGVTISPLFHHSCMNSLEAPSMDNPPSPITFARNERFPRSIRCVQ